MVLLFQLTEGDVRIYVDADEGDITAKQGHYVSMDKDEVL